MKLDAPTTTPHLACVNQEGLESGSPNMISWYICNASSVSACALCAMMCVVGVHAHRPHTGPPGSTWRTLMITNCDSGEEACEEYTLHNPCEDATFCQCHTWSLHFSQQWKRKPTITCFSLDEYMARFSHYIGFLRFKSFFEVFCLIAPSHSCLSSLLPPPQADEVPKRIKQSFACERKRKGGENWGESHDVTDSQ